jgi:hypothetical protein
MTTMAKKGIIAVVILLISLGVAIFTGTLFLKIRLGSEMKDAEQLGQQVRAFAERYRQTNKCFPRTLDALMAFIREGKCNDPELPATLIANRVQRRIGQNSIRWMPLDQGFYLTLLGTSYSLSIIEDSHSTTQVAQWTSFCRLCYLTHTRVLDERETQVEKKTKDFFRKLNE